MPLYVLWRIRDASTLIGTDEGKFAAHTSTAA